jgi:sterol 14alpha-demethylase
MGQEIREHLFKEVSDLYHKLDEGTTPISFFLPYLPIKPHRERDRARLEMVRLFSKVMQDRRDKNVQGDDMLQKFMDATYKDGTSLSDTEVTGLMIALLFGGQHTSMVTSSWMLLYILSNPDVRERLLEEQRQFPELNYPALREMTLLHNCIRETLRLSPPLMLLMRKVGAGGAGG